MSETPVSDTSSVVIEPPAGLRVRILYRESDGAMHFDWPLERLREAYADAAGLIWIDIVDAASAGTAQVEEILRGVFAFHPLAIEDALTDTLLPKVDDWGSYLYIVFQAIQFEESDDSLHMHELDLFVGNSFLLSYHVSPMPFLSQVLRNIERDPENRMSGGGDALLHQLLDLGVGEFLPALEHLDEAIDAAQEEVFARPTPRTLQSIFQVKRSSLRLHRMLGPTREMLNRLARDSYAPIRPERRIYFRDVYDELIRVHDLSESLRDLITGALDTYLSAVSNRTNDIMKTLTIVSVMFLPLSFVVGFFGMNFFSDNLAVKAELPRGLLFWITCLIMVGTPFVMYAWARRRGWF